MKRVVLIVALLVGQLLHHRLCEGLSLGRKQYAYRLAIVLCFYRFDPELGQLRVLNLMGHRSKGFTGCVKDLTAEIWLSAILLRQT